MRRRLLAAIAVVVVACVAVSLIEGRPRQLPGVSLGSAVLLHAERTLALLALTVALLSIVMHAARGRLPIELSTSGLRYDAETADAAAMAVAQLQDQLDDLVAIVDALAERLDAPLTSMWRHDDAAADKRRTAARVRPRAGQGDARAQRAASRGGPKARELAAPDRRAAALHPPLTGQRLPLARGRWR
jgi:hypothetical protein